MKQDVWGMWSKHERFKKKKVMTKWSDYSDYWEPQMLYPDSCEEHIGSFFSTASPFVIFLLKDYWIVIVLKPIIFRHPFVPLDRLFFLCRIPYPTLLSHFLSTSLRSHFSTETFSVFTFYLLETSFGISLTAWTFISLIKYCSIY